jgi:hypothetical protein
LLFLFLQVGLHDGKVNATNEVEDSASKDARLLNVGHRSGLVSRHLDFNTSSKLETFASAVEARDSVIDKVSCIFICFNPCVLVS